MVLCHKSFTVMPTVTCCVGTARLLHNNLIAQKTFFSQDCQQKLLNVKYFELVSCCTCTYTEIVCNISPASKCLLGSGRFSSYDWLQTVLGGENREKCCTGYRTESLKKYINKVIWLQSTLHSIQSTKQMR
jgi:hypothetical protein